jgi:2-methylcitrate dehydratase PrpD
MSGTSTERRRTQESNLSSETSRKTERIIVFQNDAYDANKFNKKPYVHNEVISMPGKDRRLRQKQNSLSILGFKTNTNSKDKFLKKKNKKKGKKRSKEEEVG